jgi:hypothetical protein
MVCAIGIYYSLRGCLEYDAAEWDLLRTPDWSLITNVVDILWRVRLPACSNHTDPCGVVSVGFDFFMLVGVAAPIVLWKKRSVLRGGVGCTGRSSPLLFHPQSLYLPDCFANGADGLRRLSLHAAGFRQIKSLAAEIRTERV